MQIFKDILLTIILVLIIEISVQSIAAQSFGFDEIIRYQVSGPLTFLLFGVWLLSLAGLGRKMLKKQSQSSREFNHPFLMIKEHRNLSVKHQ